MVITIFIFITYHFYLFIIFIMIYLLLFIIFIITYYFVLFLLVIIIYYLLSGLFTIIHYYYYLFINYYFFVLFLLVLIIYYLLLREGCYILSHFKELRPEVKFCIIFISSYYLLFYLLHVANTLCWTSITSRHRKFPTPREISRNLCPFSTFGTRHKPNPVCILVEGWPQGSRLTQTSSAPRQASDPVLNDHGHLAGWPTPSTTTKAHSRRHRSPLHPFQTSASQSNNRHLAWNIRHQAWNHQALGLLKMVP